MKKAIVFDFDGVLGELAGEFASLTKEVHKLEKKIQSDGESIL